MSWRRGADGYFHPRKIERGKFPKEHRKTDKETAAICLECTKQKCGGNCKRVKEARNGKEVITGSAAERNEEKSGEGENSI